MTCSCGKDALWIVNGTGYCKAHKHEAVVAQAAIAKTWDRKPWWERIEKPKRVQATQRFIERLGEL